jgi:hypothetical protein
MIYTFTFLNIFVTESDSRKAIGLVFIVEQVCFTSRH